MCRIGRLAGQRKVGCAILEAVSPVCALLAAHGLQQRHEKPTLRLGKPYPSYRTEGRNGRAHAALAFRLVIGRGSVTHMAGCRLQDVVRVHRPVLPKPPTARIVSSSDSTSSHTP